MIRTSQWIAPSTNAKQERAQEVLSGLRVGEGAHGVSYEPSTADFDAARMQLRAVYHTSEL